MSLRKAAFSLFLLAPVYAGDALVSHEWGTFTSVAGEDGRPVKWAPLTGPADLPCFVTRLYAFSPKHAAGFVRMETPVLYFYSATPVTLSIRVDFPQGWITEWFPRATKAVTNSPGSPAGYRNGRIEWDSVEVLPGTTPEFPSSRAASHYYAARETDSAPLRVGGQWEKLIFYRGIGDFEVPVQPAFTSQGTLKIRNAGPETIPVAILFENRQGKLGFRFARGIKDVVEVDPPELEGTLEDLRERLATELVEFGLYRREALAMIETWRDSWFEEGMRVFYIVPRAQVDSLLPLSITPRPASIARVFVGRVEVLSPWLRQKIETASAHSDLATLTRFGRFLEPFGAQLRPFRSPALEQATAKLLRQQLSSPACVE